jgi:DNA primase
MNCQQANQIDMVEFLSWLGYSPDKIRGNDYWYRSPLREEHHASFKINRSRNMWYDHGEGTGGVLVDFAILYYGCSLAQALEKISSANSGVPITNSKPPTNLVTESENTITVIKAIHPIQNQSLLDYLKIRQIDLNVARKFCREVLYENDGKKFTAIGFKNNAGGYELRSQYFKGCSSPKYVSWFNNRADNISVFEGFFDFLTWHTVNRQQSELQTNFLVLNSLSFFTRSLLLQEKYDRVHLYLDNDEAGRKCVKEIQNRSPAKVLDESRHYKDFKDLNDWFIEKKLDVHVKQSKQMRL